jgi:hypothetical protein
MVVEVGAVKGFQQKGNEGWKQDETQLTTKIDVFLSFSGLFEPHPVYDQTQGSHAMFSFTDFSNT